MQTKQHVTCLFVGWHAANDDGVCLSNSGLFLFVCRWTLETILPGNEVTLQQQ